MSLREREDALRLIEAVADILTESGKPTMADELEAAGKTLRAQLEAAEARYSEFFDASESAARIAGWGGVAGDAPERIVLASEMYDGIESCDKWLDVCRVIDNKRPIPESATAYVRADLADAAIARAEAAEAEVARLSSALSQIAEQDAAFKPGWIHWAEMARIALAARTKEQQA